jgi:DNA repair protein SbcC/Rad50
MRLRRIALRGVTRFTDDVALDLDRLPAGLVAFVGRNGDGKTTLLEAGPATIHRQFPSRADKELVDYATTRDAYLESLWDIAGRGEYRLRVNLDGVARKADAVVLQAGPGQQTPLNDGKVKTFDAATAKLFPPRDVLWASAVAAQNNAGSFISLDKAGKLQLLIKLLGLEQYEAMAKLAKSAATIWSTAEGKLGAQRDLLARLVKDDAAEDLDVALTEIEAHLAQIVDDLSQWDLTCETLQARRLSLGRDAARHIEAQAEVRRLRGCLDSVTQRQAAYEQQKRHATQQAKAQEQAHERERRQRTADIEQRIANNQAVLAQADDIRAAARRVEDATAAIAAAREELTRVEGQREALLKADHQLARAETTASRAAQDLATHRQHAAAIATAPFGERCAEASCHALDIAIRAKAQITPELERQADEVDTLAEARAALAADYQANRAAIARVSATIREHEEAITAAQALAKLLPQVEVAEQRIRDYREELRRLDEACARAIADVAAALGARLADLADAAVAAADEAADLAPQLADHERVAHDTAQAAHALTQVETELQAHHHHRERLVRSQADLEARRRGLAERRARVAQAQADLEDVDARRRRAQDEMLEWQLLVRALGRDGLPMLEIDAAGPTVSTYCNDLLSVCFGPRFTIELVTQVAKLEGKGTKDTCELKVFDNVRGGDPRDIGDLSGGEKILVDEAVKNALALYINSRNVNRIETCWRDETTGPLDGENARRYLEMLRRVQAIGGFHHILFVTHNADAAMQADAQVHVHDGTAEIVLPPYRVTA